MSKLQYRTCRHLSADGRPCGSPALREQFFCYYHHRDRQRQKLLSGKTTRRILRLTPDVLDALQLPAPDDPASIRVCIATLMRGILSGLIDRDQAGQVLYLIQLATVNNQRALDYDEDTYVHAITDPEPILVPEEESNEVASAGHTDAGAVAGYESLEVVMVRPRRDYTGDQLAPTEALQPASLDDFDLLRVTPPQPAEQQEEEDEEMLAT